VVRGEAFLERTVCHDHVFVGQDVRLRGSVIGRATDLRAHARCEEGVVIGDECFVGENAVVNPGVRIYPFKTVEAGAVVNSSIVWESRAARTLFGRRGIRGLANVDVTPEIAVRVAAALGTALKKGAVVTASRDTSRAARALKRAVIGGLNLAGVNVEDIELATVPLTRFQVRNSGASAGVTVRLAPDDPDSIEIRFFDADGVDIDANTQRKVERLLYGRTSGARSPATSATSCSRPARSSSTPRPWSAAWTRRGCASAPPRWCSTTRTARRRSSLPSVLAKLGAEVLAVNPFASTIPLTLGDPSEQVTRIVSLVRASGSELGYVLTPDGERATIIDDEGHVVGPEQALLALVALVASGIRVRASRCRCASRRRRSGSLASGGAEVVWTKLADSSLMEVAANEDITFAASFDGGFIWPDFLPAFDALATLAKLLDLLAATGRRLSDVVRDLPSVAIAHESVPTPWERKGAVMRELVERVPQDSLVLIDGVKILRDDGWVLVLPDPEEPSTHVWAEAGNDNSARQVAQEYARRIRQIVR
jgi:mannose-1-phosphate guanylyltransferase/phosphomannomutase